MSSQLILEPKIAEADRFYEALIDAHRGLTESESAAYNARLILLLANQVGDLPVLLQALDCARAKP